MVPPIEDGIANAPASKMNHELLQLLLLLLLPLRVSDAVCDLRMTCV